MSPLLPQPCYPLPKPYQMTPDPGTLLDDLTGKVLGNYVLIRRLGRGGMANVYLAQQTTLNRPVAIKVLRSELALDRAYVARFHREAEAAAALNQANIVQIFEVGEIDGVHFIAQEYVRGQNLRQYLHRNKVVEPILAVSIMRQVAAALQRAGEKGVIHRDIKPENIMLASNGEVKVTDFGLARVLNDNRADLTQIGITMGTPLYMSPEQAEGKPVDSRSDLYSLGITSWHMFAGKPPFEGDNALAVAVKHVKEELRPIAKVRPDLPKELCEIVDKLAEKDPAQRFQTPALLIKQLRALEIDDVEDWEQLSEKLAIVGDDVDGNWDSTSATQLQVTRQLATVMKGSFRPWWQSPTLWVATALMALVGAGFGAIAAWSNPPANPIDSNQVATAADLGVVKKETAYDQYYHAYAVAGRKFASNGQKVKHWEAIESYFPISDDDGRLNPKNLLFARRAKVRLAEHYMSLKDYLSALECFDELSSLGRDEDQFRITGIVGRAIVYEKLAQEYSLTALDELFPVFELDYALIFDTLIPNLKDEEIDNIESDLIKGLFDEMQGEKFTGPIHEYTPKEFAPSQEMTPNPPPPATEQGPF